MSESSTPTAGPTESAHTAGLRRAVRLGALGLVALMVVSALVWWLVDGTPGLWGALIGAAIGGVFVLLTAIVVIATARTTPQVTGAVLLGTWLLKLIVHTVRFFFCFSRVLWRSVLMQGCGYTRCN